MKNPTLLDITTDSFVSSLFCCYTKKQYKYLILILIWVAIDR